MNWYYASGGQQAGPVDDAALDELVRQGIVRDDTLVWRQGLAGWQAHSVARPRPAAPPTPAAPAAPSAPSAPAASPAAQWSPTPAAASTPQPAPAHAAPSQEMRFCSNCGRPTPVSQLTTVSGASVCAACLPSLSAPGNAPSPAAPQPGYPSPGFQTPGYQPAGFQPPYQTPGGYAPAVAYPPGPMAGQPQYGGFWIRFLARVIDGIILGIIGMIIQTPLTLLMGGIGAGLGRSSDPAAVLAALPAFFGIMGLSILINVVVGFLYEVYFLTSRGATPGKMALGLRVIRADGGPITMGVAAGRYFAYWLSSLTLTIGFIIAGFDVEKRSLHDRICNTRVIRS